MKISVERTGGLAALTRVWTVTAETERAKSQWQPIVEEPSTDSEPGWLTLLRGDDHFASIQTVTLRSAKDSDLPFVGDLASLRDAQLRGPNVTDAGLVHLARLHNLTRLDLFKTSVSGPGLVHIRTLQKLERLSLAATQITDESLGHCGAIASLQFLELYDTQVSDAGLEHLHGLSSLRILDVRSTRVTKVGVAALKAALPRCTVFHD